MGLNTAYLAIDHQIRDELVAGTTRPADVPINISYKEGNTYTSGTGANLATKSAYFATTLTATTTDYDLTATLCSDGSTGFSYIRSILVVNLATTDLYTLKVGGAASNGFTYPFNASTEKLVVQPSSRAVFEKPIGTSGWLVDATHKLLKFDSGTNTVPFALYILGN